MKNYAIILFLILSFKNFAQSDPKTAFQKSRYELALSYYKKSDYKTALDLFSIASKIKPENEIGKESIKRVDSLKTILRTNYMHDAIGVWKLAGDKPVWASTAENSADKEADEMIEISENKIVFYEINKKTKIKTVQRTEDLVYYNKDAGDALFSEIILSDGTIWNCILSESSDVLHVINVAKKQGNEIEKVTSNNLELFYVKIN